MINLSVFYWPLRKSGKAYGAIKWTLVWGLSRLIKPRYAPQQAK